MSRRRFPALLLALALACLASVAAPRAAWAQKSGLSKAQLAKKQAYARYNAQQRALYQQQLQAQQQAYQAQQKQAVKQAKFQMECQRTAAMTRIANAAATEAAVAKKELQIDQMRAGVPFIPTPNGMMAYPFSPGGGPPIP